MRLAPLFPTAIAALFITSAQSQTLWTRQFLPNAGTLRSVAFSSEKGFVVVGEGPSGSPAVFEGRVYTSKDAIVWKQQTSPPVNMLSVAWGQDQYMAVGKTGTILSSGDGANWTSHVSGTSSDLWSVAWVPTLSGTPGMWIAAGNDGTLLTSLDGATWNMRNSGVNTSLRSVIRAPLPNDSSGLLIVVGTSGTILTSPDGIAWTPRNSGTANGLSDVAWGNGQLLAVGGVGTLLTSPDGVSWMLNKKGSGLWNAVEWGPPSQGGFGFLISQHIGSLHHAPDGVTWTEIRPNGTSESYVSVLWTGSGYALAGLNGSIMVSHDTIRPGIPTLKAPADGAIDIPPSVTLSWAAVAGVRTYHVQVSSDTSFHVTTVNDSLVADTNRIAGLSASTGYYWRVRARTLAGAGAWSEIRTFTRDTTPVAIGRNSIFNMRFTRLIGNSELRFNLLKPEKVLIRVFDPQGSLALLLLNETREAGLHQVVLPASLPSGIYFLSLRAGKHHETLKFYVD